MQRSYIILWEAISGTSPLNSAEFFVKSASHAEAQCEGRLCRSGKPCLRQHGRGRHHSMTHHRKQELGTGGEWASSPSPRPPVRCRETHSGCCLSLVHCSHKEQGTAFDIIYLLLLAVVVVLFIVVVVTVIAKIKIKLIQIPHTHKDS